MQVFTEQAKVLGESTSKATKDATNAENFDGRNRSPELSWISSGCAGGNIVRRNISGCIAPKSVLCGWHWDGCGRFHCQGITATGLLSIKARIRCGRRIPKDAGSPPQEEPSHD